MKDSKFAGREIKIVNNLFKRYIDKNKSIKEEKLTSMQSWIIRYLYKNNDKDIFQKDIEKEFSIRRSTATVLLQLMEKNDLIIKESVDYDARLKKLNLTNKSLNIHKMIIEDIRNFEKQLINGISEDDLKTFFKVIEKMKQNIE